MSPTSSTSQAPVDGRRARRELGRAAVIDALLDLLFEGEDTPSPEQLGDRAGVSVASVFRYFDGLDDLRAQAVQRYFDRTADLFEVPDLGAGRVDHRIRRLVDARLRQHATTAPVARVVRREARRAGILADALGRLRATQSDQLRIHFGPELGRLGPARRDDLVATIAVLTSFESWEQFVTVGGRTTAQIRRAWCDALDGLLG